ncbi:four helix bundle protein, partial [Desulfoplanes sp.]
GKGGFRELLVWQRSKALAVEIYRLTSCGAVAKDFGLKDQMRRCAVSVPSNIAEGDERFSDKEAVRFFYIAKGSLAELRTQFEIGHEIGYFDVRTFGSIDAECCEIGNMLGGLIRVRKGKG